MPDRMFTQEELDARIREERNAQKVHDVNGQIQGQTAAQQIAAALAPLLAAKPQAERDVPGWVKISGAFCALFVSGAAVLGIVWSVAIGPVHTRLDVLEKADVAQLARLLANENRANANESRIVQLDTALSTGTRIRDQQQQAIMDQVRGLSQADQAATERLAQQSNIIASILPRLEEILRRQERLENRLGANRAQPNSDDSETPARFWAMPLPAI